MVLNWRTAVNIVLIVERKSQVSEEEPVHIRVRMDYFEEGFGQFHVKAVQIDKR